MMMTGDPGIEQFRSHWKWFVGIGIALAILGVVMLFNAVDATLVTTILLGFLLVAAGTVQVIGAFATPQKTSSRIIQGVLGALYVIVGLYIVSDPLAGAIALTIVVAIWLIVDGAIRLIEAIMYRPPHWVLAAVVAVLTALLGLWLWSGLPLSGIAIGFFVGLQVLMAGLLWIGLGWMARSLARQAEPAPETAPQG
jgi:uncharacterized membrane protein HdeD (DUF308 family)